MDFVLNGQGHGSVADKLLAANFDAGGLRPYIDHDDVPEGAYPRQDQIHPGTYITQNGEAVPVANTNYGLLRLEWTLLDQVVVRAALPRLRAVADVRGRGLQMTIPNGLAKTVLQTQAQSDISAASISMDGISRSRGDRPIYNLNNLPLPIIHKDFSFSARQLAVSRNGGMPLDLSMAELAARRVAEAAEQLLLGVSYDYTYGGGSVYGMVNFPSRLKYALSDPTDSTWTARDTLLDVLAMRYQSQRSLHYGPWILYVSLAWDKYLDDDLSIYKGNITLRDRLRAIDGIEDVVTVDYLNGYDMVLCQMTTDVIREVVGMDITTVQWESQGGMELNFKVMCILVPQLRADFNGRTGIVHAAVSGESSTVVGGIYAVSGNP